MFVVHRDTLVTGGYDSTETERYRNLLADPLATIGRGAASIEEHRSGLKIRIAPQSWDLDPESTGVQRHGV